MMFSKLRSIIEAMIRPTPANVERVQEQMSYQDASRCKHDNGFLKSVRFAGDPNGFYICAKCKRPWAEILADYFPEGLD